LESGWKKEVKLKDGRIATIGFLSRRDDAGELRNYINSFVGEKAFLLADRKYSLKEEKEWKTNTLKAMRKGGHCHLIARVDGEIAGTTDAKRGKFKEKNNVSLGIAIAKPYRGIGLGEALLGENIRIAKRRWKPRNVFLSVLAPNRPARSLYRKLGFREFAIFPKWLLHEGRYIDQVFLKLKN